MHIDRPNQEHLSKSYYQEVTALLNQLSPSSSRCKQLLACRPVRQKATKLHEDILLTLRKVHLDDDIRAIMEEFAQRFGEAIHDSGIAVFDENTDDERFLTEDELQAMADVTANKQALNRAYWQSR